MDSLILMLKFTFIEKKNQKQRKTVGELEENERIQKRRKLRIFLSYFCYAQSEIGVVFDFGFCFSSLVCLPCTD